MDGRDLACAWAILLATAAFLLLVRTSMGL